MIRGEKRTKTANMTVLHFGFYLGPDIFEREKQCFHKATIILKQTIIPVQLAPLWTRTQNQQ